MRIAVMGAGGIGGYLAARFAKAGADVGVIARGPHLAALRAEGLTLETPTQTIQLPDIKAVSDAAELGPVDVVFFTVKLPDVQMAADALGPLLHERTRIVTLQNGIDAPGLLARRWGEASVVPGAIFLSAHIQRPGVISHPGGVHRMTVAARPGDVALEALLAYGPGLEGLELTAHADADVMLWDKFVSLTAFAGITFLLRGPIGLVHDQPQTRAFLCELFAEALAVARAEGVNFGADALDRRLNGLLAQPRSMKTSMLVDLEAGRPLELAWLNGRICERALAHGIKAPAHRAVVAALSPFAAGRP